MTNRVICYISLCFFMLLSCKKSTDDKSSYFSKEDKRADTLEVIYHHNKKIKELFLSQYENEKNVRLFFSENGKIEKKVLNFNSYPEDHYEYNQNGKLIHQWRQGNIGGCIAIIDREIFWDGKENITKEIIHKSIGNRCSEKILLQEIKEYFPGTKKVRSLSNTHESYEGSAECPCGIWKEYDKDQRVIGQTKYVDCSDTNTFCEDGNIDNENY
ncbi:hypothetical protein [Epilithonimonas lactis]|nr:hypothetical protein [Epilithonimonas lactis]SER02355.1 hypothetical protein SAMN04488097_3686 [Epilithonimonas lactis]